MRVAIWGSYEHGNFGDDLMAIIFALHLKKLGCVPIIYRLNKEIANRFKLETTDNINELFLDVSFGIIGGGGMLVVDPSFRRFFSRVAWKFESDYKELYKVLNSKSNVEIIPLSIGGNGDNQDKDNLPNYRNKVFTEFVKRGSFRLSGDIPLAKKLDINHNCIPDVLLFTSSLFPQEREINKPIKRIGINLVGSNSIKLSKELEQLSLNDAQIEIVFIHTHLKEYGHNYELCKTINNCERITDFCHNDDFMRTFKLLASLDLLISSKLHLGLTALTYGTPFISFNGKKKTNSFLNSVSKEKTVYFEGEEALVVKNIIKGTFYNFDNLINSEVFNQSSSDSIAHLDYLSTIVNEYEK
jgi:hypothetical protein